jgi:Tol biopolymer transport system component
MNKLHVVLMFLIPLLVMVQTADAALFQLTTDTANERNPSWSPDGQFIVYSKDDGNGSDLCIVPVAGGTPQVLTSGHCDMYPSWSPDGTTIVFCRRLNAGTSNFFLATIPATGGEATALTDGTYPVMYPSWSADGNKIVCMMEDSSFTVYQIVALPSTGGDGTTLTEFTVDCYTPKFNQRDNRIVFSAVYPGSDENLFIMNEDGSGLRQLTTSTESETQPDWAPNGTMIIYSDRSGPDCNLYVIPSEGSDMPKQFTNFQADERNPVWSHDGDKVAFESDRMGNCDIWVMDNVWLKVVPTTVGKIKAAYQ